jgi:chromosomal replication initiation ATPase DnaA
MRQIALPLDKLRSGGSDSLIITPSNADAFSALGNHSAWPGHCAILVGPSRSGKSLMARYFAEQGGEVIDDAESLADEELFHLWNAALGAGRSILMLSTKAPAEWDVALPDLRSRLGASQLLEIQTPDDDLIEQLLLKHLHDRGTSIGPEALSFVVKRVERSHAALEEFARNANARALAQGSAINLPLVRTLFLE